MLIKKILAVGLLVLSLWGSAGVCWGEVSAGTNTGISNSNNSNQNSESQSSGTSGVSDEQINATTTKLQNMTFDLCNYGLCLGKMKTLEDLINNIIKLMVGVISLLSVTAFMWGAYNVMVRVEDDDRKYGKNLMKYSIVAIIIVLASYVIVTFVQQLMYGIGQ